MRANLSVTEPRRFPLPPAAVAALVANKHAWRRDVEARKKAEAEARDEEGED